MTKFTIRLSALAIAVLSKLQRVRELPPTRKSIVRIIGRRLIGGFGVMDGYTEGSKLGDTEREGSRLGDTEGNDEGDLDGAALGARVTDAI